MCQYEQTPCLNCTRVKDPANCENKNCRVWREWFTNAWEVSRNLPALQREIKKVKVNTVSIGGVQYAHPDQVTDYLCNNPCDSCPFPKEFCNTPCPAKRAWMEVRKEVRP